MDDSAIRQQTKCACLRIILHSGLMQGLLLPPLRSGSVDSVIQPSGRVMCVALVSHTLVYIIPLQPPPLQQPPQQPQQLQQLQLKQPLPYPQPPYPSKPRRPPPHPSQHQLWSIISLQILLLPPLRASRMTTVTQPSGNLVCVIIYSSTIVYTIPARSITASAPQWRFSSLHSAVTTTTPTTPTATTTTPTTPTTTQLPQKLPLPCPQTPYPSKPRHPPPHQSQHQLWSIISMQILLLPPLRGSRPTTVLQPSRTVVYVVI